jgi:hypothetical protein
MHFRSAIKLFLSLALLTLGVRPPARAQEAAPSEYQLKAAFLYNFAKFVSWPPEAFPEPSSPFVIGVIGDNPFGEDLEHTVKDKVLNGHPFAVREVKALSEVKNCHILFISASERKRLPEILEAARGANVLTVSELERFLQSGGMIHFIMEGNKVRFEINDEPARNSGLKISSKLLSLARGAGRGQVK